MVQPQAGNQPAYTPPPSNGYGAGYQMQPSAPYAEQQHYEKPDGNGQMAYGGKPEAQYFAPAKPKAHDLWRVARTAAHELT